MGNYSDEDNGILKKKGYDSGFYHGATNGSMRFNGFAVQLGFNHYFGRYEYNNDQHFDKTWGILDEYFNPWTAQQLSAFLNALDSKDKLTKTIIYNLNPSDNEVMATMIGNFNDGSVKGKVQFGSGWWFLDQKDGMTKQLNALSNMSLISCFVGMLTDSRSFLSFPRHEYFRRILCNLLGGEIQRGELPKEEIEWIGKLVADISFYNAKEYFKL